MRKVLLTLLSLLIISSMILAGCSSPETAAEPEVEEPEQSEEAEVPETADEEETVSEEEPAASESSDDLYTVKMVYWPGPEADATQIVIDYFNENHSEEAGYKVELLLFGRDQMWTKQEAIMAAESSEADTYFLVSRSMDKYAQFLEPIEPYFDDPEVNIWGAKQETFMKAAIDGLSVDGVQIAVPRDISMHFLYYRQDLIDELLSNAEWQETYKALSLEKLGVELEPKDPSEWTWDDYLAASYFFTKQYNPDSPTEYGNYTHGKVMGPTAFLFTNALWSNGGEWFDENGAPTFDNDATLKTLELWKTFFEDGLTPPSSVVGEYPECNEALITGQSALAIHWNAAFNTLDADDSAMKGKFAVTTPPSGPEGRYTYNHTLAVAVSKFSEHKEEAASFLLYLMTDEAAQMYAEAGGIPPAADVLSSLGDQRPEFPAMADAVDNYGKALPPYTTYYEILVCENLSNGWTGVVSLEDAIEELQNQAEIEYARHK